MIDPEQFLVVAPHFEDGRPCDRTSSINSAYSDARTGKVTIAYKSGGDFVYNHPRARLLEVVSRGPLPPDEVLLIDGMPWGPPLNVSVFRDTLDPSFSWVRIIRESRGGSKQYGYSGDRVRWLPSASRDGVGSEVLRYWRQVVTCLESEDSQNPEGEKKGSLRDLHEDMRFVHPDSALAAYLEAGNSGTSFPEGPVILPFRSNEDQRDAVVKALRHRVSAIDGPPGTGKTETILNLIANILLIPGRTVGVVSFGNAAVDNVRDKLEEAGIGFVAARVGSAGRVREFLHDQDHEDVKTGRDSRNVRLGQWLDRPPLPLPAPTADHSVDDQGRSHPAADLFDQVAASERRLVSIWRAARELAQVRNLIEAYTLESAHLERRTEGETLPDLADLPLLSKESGRILDYLAETRIRPDLPGGVRGLVPRLRRYFQYGRLKDLDPTDAATVLQLERAFYAIRLDELRQEERTLIGRLDSQDAESVRQQHESLSRGLLDRALRERYSGKRRRTFDNDQRRISSSRCTPEFLAEYPVVLTTCHSIRRNLAEPTLLDWLIIDEATQTGLLTAALAMSRARNVVVVGDLKQLGHILGKTKMGAGNSVPEPPAPGYDVEAHSILSSVVELYGEELPRTMLREHFRCAPAIIEFCNRMYYDGALIPCRAAHHGDGVSPLEFRRMAPGNHMRQIRKGKVPGTYNRREVDETAEYVEGVLAVAEVDRRRLGVNEGSDLLLGMSTPFRLQADRLHEAVGGKRDGGKRERWLAETVHKFQGRGVREMVFSAVVDESWLGHMKLKFVDDPRLINVAVSRAKDRFVLVANHDGVPQSTHIKALIDYIQFQDPGQIVDGRIVSVFDLLYREYG